MGLSISLEFTADELAELAACGYIARMIQMRTCDGYECPQGCEECRETIAGINRLLERIEQAQVTLARHKGDNP